MHKLTLILSLLLLTALAAGCADQSDGAPDTNQPHPQGAAWLLPSGHPTAAVDESLPCFGCHQENVGGAAPACSQCHTAGAPNFIVGTCDSCHSKPPDGDARPNREGAHTTHNALPKVTDVCATCHNGAGSGTLHHYDTSAPADVAFLAAYNAKTGAASLYPRCRQSGYRHLQQRQLPRRPADPRLVDRCDQRRPGLYQVPRAGHRLSDSPVQQPLLGTAPIPCWNVEIRLHHLPCSSQTGERAFHRPGHSRARGRSSGNPSGFYKF